MIGNFGVMKVFPRDVLMKNRVRTSQVCALSAMIFFACAQVCFESHDSSLKNLIVRCFQIAPARARRALDVRGTKTW